MANHIRNQTLSMRGQPIDFGALAQKNATQRALGNANVNVRGDILGAGGVILKTQEQLEAEWARRSAQTATVNASIKSDSLAPKPSPLAEEAKANALFEPEGEFQTIDQLVTSGAVTPASKRKIVE